MIHMILLVIWWVKAILKVNARRKNIYTVLSKFSSKTASDSQHIDLLSVSRFVTVLDEADKCGVVYKLQELDRGVFWCAVIRVQGEEQWGENTALRSSSADRTGAGCVFSQPHYLLPVCQEAVDPLTDRGWHRELS